MLSSVVRTIRYARSWTLRSEAEERELVIDREGTEIPATLVLPPARRSPLPAWVVIGGVTRMGRFHPQLRRFSHALASSGAAVLVPEIPEWQRLEPTPRVTAPTLRASIRLLASRPEVRPGKVGVVGLSFGAPQVVNAAVDMPDDIAGAVLFGGYLDLERTLRYQLTGEHEWQGERYRGSPDPYGRWVLASNYLTHVPGFEDVGDVAKALHRLASAASGLRCPAWLPDHDALKEELRLCLPERRRGLFDLLAPRSGAPGVEGHEADAWASRLAEACLRVDPLLDPTRSLPDPPIPIRLIHGRGDRLVPFTESLRFHDAISTDADSSVTITGLFEHSADRRPPSAAARFREGVRLFGAVREVVAIV